MKLSMSKKHRVLFVDNGSFKEYHTMLKPADVVKQLRQNVQPEKVQLELLNGTTTLMSSFNGQEAYAVMFYRDGYGIIFDVNHMNYRTSKMYKTTLPKNLVKIEKS